MIWHRVWSSSHDWGSSWMAVDESWSGGRDGSAGAELEEAGRAREAAEQAAFQPELSEMGSCWERHSSGRCNLQVLCSSIVVRHVEHDARTARLWTGVDLDWAWPGWTGPDGTE